jgi:hypothetical protein
MKRSVHDLLCDAIRNRQLVRFEYHGGLRTVEPHVFGLNSNGEEVLSGFQQYGFSRSHAPHHWKQFKVSEMESFEVLPKMFSGPRPGYHGDLHVKDVICSIREDGPPLEKESHGQEQRTFDIELEGPPKPGGLKPTRAARRPHPRSLSKWQRIRTEFVKEDELD